LMAKSLQPLHVTPFAPQALSSDWQQHEQASSHLYP
jgi:hypothetical protein